MSNYHSNIKMYNITVMGDQIVNKNNATSSTKIGSDFDYEDQGSPKKGWHVEKTPKKSESSSFDSIPPKKSDSFDSFSTKKSDSLGSIPKMCSSEPPGYESSAEELSGVWDFERSFKKSCSESSSDSYFTANLGESFSKPETPERYQLGVFEGTQVNIWGDKGLDSSSESVYPDTFLSLDSPKATSSFSNIFPDKFLCLESPTDSHTSVLPTKLCLESPTSVFPDVFSDSFSNIFPNKSDPW